jgi:predicted kinase
VIIEVDRYYYDNHGVYRWSERRREAAWRKAFSAFDRSLRRLNPPWAAITVGVPGSGKSRWACSHDGPGLVIVDGVFANPKLRQEALTISKHRGVPLMAIWLDTPWELCVGRNELREPDRRVPNASLREFSEVLTAYPPTIDEGFAAVERLTLAAIP